MKIVKIANHCCMRVQKEALPLIDRGHEVHLITHKLPVYADFYKTVTMVIENSQLYSAIKLHADADIFHVHNEPSWYVTAVKEIFPDKPVILDVHDSMLGRVLPGDKDHVRVSVDERNNFTLADGLVFVSKELRDICRNDFALTQPHTVLPSYVPERFYTLDSWRWKGGIVYEGRVDTPEKLGKSGEGTEFFTYCDYTEAAKRIHEQGLGLFLYSPQPDPKKIQNHYGDTAKYQGQYVFNEMIRNIGRHDWGLIGNVDVHPAWQVAMPNKLFEYMAAGVPIVVMNAKASEEFILEHNLGISVQSFEELKERWREKRKCRENVIKKRRQFSMEKHIHVVEALYAEFV